MGRWFESTHSHQRGEPTNPARAGFFCCPGLRSHRLDLGHGCKWPPASTWPREDSAGSAFAPWTCAVVVGAGRTRPGLGTAGAAPGPAADGHTAPDPT